MGARNASGDFPSVENDFNDAFIVGLHNGPQVSKAASAVLQAKFRQSNPLAGLKGGRRFCHRRRHRLAQYAMYSTFFVHSSGSMPACHVVNAALKAASAASNVSASPLGGRPPCDMRGIVSIPQWIKVPMLNVLQLAGDRSNLNAIRRDAIAVLAGQPVGQLRHGRIKAPVPSEGNCFLSKSGAASEAERGNSRQQPCRVGWHQSVGRAILAGIKLCQR
jgi:hypothetical protein